MKENRVKERIKIRKYIKWNEKRRWRLYMKI